MGLDMWVRRVRKPNLEDRVYTAEEISSMGYSAVPVEETEDNCEQLIPYTVVRNVLTKYYDKAKMIEDYNLPKNSHINTFTADGIRISGKNNNGEYVGQFISRRELEEKYIITESVPTYIWYEEDEAYWRKHYELQQWFYDNLEDVDNCGYYILDAEQIAEMNTEFGEHVSEEDPTDDEALFYHEWY